MPDLEARFRRGIEAFTSGDLDAAMTLYAPNAVWDTSPMGIGVYEGHEAIRRFFEDWRGAYRDFEQGLDEFRGLGNSVVFVVIRQRGRLPDSSGFVELRYAAVATLSDALVERATAYTDLDEARAAAERLAEERG
jgi:ketosteroid isomerase-like protein